MPLNIVMPIAGAGQRFKDAGFTDPKPLIKVDGVPMISIVRDNLIPPGDYRSIYIIRRGIGDAISNAVVPRYKWDKVISLDAITEGAACTALLAEQLIDNYDPLLIVNGDQYIEGLDIDAFLDYAKDYHGCIMTFDVAPDDPPKWSYVQRPGIDKCTRKGERKWVLRVAEKEKISNEATCGIYYFRHGRDFLRAAHAMITKDIRTNGEFYLCPVYNEMIDEGLWIASWNVNDHDAKMHGLGTPEDLEKFLAYRDSLKRAG